VFSDLHYGFGPDHLFVRVDPVAEAIGEMQEFQIRLTIWEMKESRITLTAEQGKFGRPVVERAGMCILQPEKFVSCAYGKILEVSVARELFDLRGRKEMLLSVALWRGGLPVDVLPLEGLLNIALGEENFAWPLEESGESQLESPTLQSKT